MLHRPYINDIAGNKQEISDVSCHFSFRLTDRLHSLAHVIHVKPIHCICSAVNGRSSIFFFFLGGGNELFSVRNGGTNNGKSR